MDLGNRSEKVGNCGRFSVNSRPNSELFNENLRPIETDSWANLLLSQPIPPKSDRLLGDESHLETALRRRFSSLSAPGVNQSAICPSPGQELESVVWFRKSRAYPGGRGSCRAGNGSTRYPMCGSAGASPSRRSLRKITLWITPVRILSLALPVPVSGGIPSMAKF